MEQDHQADSQYRAKIDWDAVERDYRATNLTPTELCIKHGCKLSALSNQIKRKGWQRDLTDAVKHATNAKLIYESVAEAVDFENRDAALIESTAKAVLATAEINVRIITGHRKRLADLGELALRAQEKLEEMSENLVDVREAAVYVQAVGNLAGMTKTLIEQERKAFNLDDADSKDSKPGVEDFIEALSGKTDL